ncbi:MAG TPA: amidohydrolase [Fimbriiglobus sp.]|nr:amidohydrolase [Fimbriiglobus sp.]
MLRRTLATLLISSISAIPLRADDPADLIVHGAHVVTVDPKFTTAAAVAVRGSRIVAVGTDADVLKLKGPKTRVIDATGKTVLPGLYDSHVHPLGAALSETSGPLPVLGSVEEVLAHVRKQAAETPEGRWIVIRYAFPTRLKEARFPTKAELDAAAPRHPVLYHAGPAGVCNTAALVASGVTKDTPDPLPGKIVRDPKTGEPTGMLRNAYGVLKGVPSAGSNLTVGQKQEAVKKLFHSYNALGLTSVADRNAGREALDLYYALKEAGELTVRVNVARSFDANGPREVIARRFEDLPGKDGRGGPTGVGDEWVRVGPIKLFLDGGMLNGTAYMREPWPKGPTHQVTEDDYRGLLFIQPDQLKMVCEEAVRRKWQVTAHTAGEGAMDVLLDAYEFADRVAPIKDYRYCITHANFPSRRNLERCKALNVCADVQPAWLYKDGATQLKILGPDRMQWFQPYKTWLEYTTVGGGSDHMIRHDPIASTNPWSPWLGLWIAVTRSLERGGVHRPEECLTRELAVRLYTINNAYLHREEKEKGSLEVGKLGDLIMIDRNILTCPADDIRGTKVLLTVVGGKVVYEQK